METLKQIRKSLHMTQVDAAKVCGVSRRTYQEYEEKQTQNATFDEILAKLKEMGISGKGPALLNVRYIKQKASEIFANYKEVQCAYLFGSYARGEATIDSDVDIIVVAPKLGGFDFAGLRHDLVKALNKEVDLVNHTTLLQSEKMLRDVLNQGVKIYGQRVSFFKN